MRPGKVFASLARPRENVSGAIAFEYGVIAVAVCAVLAAVLFFFGQDIARAVSDFRTTVAPGP